MSKKITLCNPNAGCRCPVIEFSDESEVFITDDYNGKVKLTKDQAKMFSDVIRKEFKNKSLQESLIQQYKK
jgi:hypothetical protein